MPFAPIKGKKLRRSGPQTPFCSIACDGIADFARSGNEYIKEGRLTKENGILALRLLKKLRSQGKNVSLQRIIEAKNMWIPKEIEETNNDFEFDIPDESDIEMSDGILPIFFSIRIPFIKLLIRFMIIFTSALHCLSYVSNSALRLSSFIERG